MNDASVPCNSKIDGVFFIELKQITDERGGVLHMMRADSPHFTKFGECYFCEVNPGAVKAWKMHKEQSQNIAVPVGRIKLVMYDGRDNSATLGNTLVVELGRPDSYRLVRIPPGIWYGFLCISEASALLANCADIPHSKEESVQLPSGSPGIPYHW